MEDLYKRENRLRLLEQIDEQLVLISMNSGDFTATDLWWLRKVRDRANSIWEDWLLEDGRYWTPNKKE